MAAAPELGALVSRRGGAALDEAPPPPQPPPTAERSRGGMMRRPRSTAPAAPTGPASDSSSSSGSSSGSDARRVLRLVAVLVLLPAAVLCAMASTALAISHWQASESGLIIAKGDFPFKVPPSPAEHLVAFLRLQQRLEEQRTEVREVDGALYGTGKPALKPFPDLLSKNKDYVNLPTLDDVDLEQSTLLSLAHKGIAIADEVDLRTPVPTLMRTAEPHCHSELIFSMADFQHLVGVGTRAQLEVEPETLLEGIVWPHIGEDSASRRFTSEEMAPRLAMALEKNNTSWVLYNLAALYWRIRGEPVEAIECLRRALHYSPFGMRDVALVSLGNILSSAGYWEDAKVVLDAAMDCSNNTYATSFSYGNVLASLGELREAQEAYEHAITLEPEYSAAHEHIQAVMSTIKQQAVEARRDYEISLRKVSMVLPEELTWSDFDYEAIEDKCVDAICKEHSQCSDLDGKCHCDEGWLASGGECVPDEKCQERNQCKENSICRAGRCYCKTGYRVLNNKCVPDPCARVSCVEGAECNSTDGRCYCKAPLVDNGPVCVDVECQRVRCRAHAFCQHGLCYCNVGYHPDFDVCVRDTPCAKSRCPENAFCNEADGHCRCREGFEANVNSNTCEPVGKSAAPTESCTSDDGVCHAYSSPASSQPPNLPQHPTPTPSSAGAPGAADASPTELPTSMPTGEEFKIKGTREEVENQICTPRFRSIEDYDELPSVVILPIGINVKDIVTNHISNMEFPIELEVPECKVVNISMATLDHVPTMAARGRPETMVDFRPEEGLHATLRGLFPDDMSLDAIGHVIFDLMEKRKDWIGPYLATLYFRLLGYGKLALDCVHLGLYLVPNMHAKVMLVHGASLLTHAAHHQDAITLAEKAYDLAPYSNNVLMAVKYFLASQRDGNDQASALHMVRMIRCTLLFRRKAQLEAAGQSLDYPFQAHQISDQRRYLRHFEEESEKLKTRMQEIEATLIQHSFEDTEPLWEQLRELQKQLELVLQRQRNTRTMVENLERRQAEAEAQATHGHAVSSENEQRVIIVEYPKAPSIPNLIQAVREMLYKEKLVVTPAFFDDPDWPSRESCKGVDANEDIITKTFRTSVIKKLDIGSHLDFGEELSETLQPPFCEGPVPTKPAHTLQHLQGVARRTEVTLEPDKHVQQLFVPSITGQQMSTSEVGERARRLLERNDTSWAGLNIAGLYWRAIGNGYQAIECLRRAFHYSPSGSKDIALESLAHVLQATGYHSDAITVMQMAIQVAPMDYTNHLAMANLLAANHWLEEAGFFYEVVLRLRPDVVLPNRRLLMLRCFQQQQADAEALREAQEGGSRAGGGAGSAGSLGGTGASAGAGSGGSGGTGSAGEGGSAGKKRQRKKGKGAARRGGS